MVVAVAVDGEGRRTAAVELIRIETGVDDHARHVHSAAAVAIGDVAVVEAVGDHRIIAGCEVSRRNIGELESVEMRTVSPGPTVAVAKAVSVAGVPVFEMLKSVTLWALVSEISLPPFSS